MILITRGEMPLKCINLRNKETIIHLTTWEMSITSCSCRHSL